MTRMAVLFAALCAICLSASISKADTKTDMDALTGSKHTRVVWLNEGDRINGGGKLMGYDSRTNQTTQILAAAVGQNRPIICSGGHRVIVSINYKVYIVDWDGSNKQYLVDGICSDSWVHPATGKEWIVVRTGAKSTAGKLYRHLLEDPSQKFLLYDAKAVGIDYFQWWQISPDGKMAVDFLPWSKCYVIDDGGLTSNGTASQISDGCWSSVVKDNSRFWYHLTCCPHKTLKVFTYKTFVKEVAINAGPRPSGTNSDEFYHPKSASKGARFLTVTGGYTGNAGSTSAEVYLGRWSSGLTAFDGWVRLTANSAADYTPDAWVDVDAKEPSLSFSADTLRFSATQNGTAPASQDLALTTPFGTLSGVTAQSNQSWLTTQLTGSGASFSIKNTVNPSGLSAQVHAATVTVQATNANPSVKKYTVLLTITGTPIATTLSLAPVSATVVCGGTRQFSASVKDQYGSSMLPQPTISWSVAGGCGNVSTGGLFTAGASAGLCTVKVSAGTLTSQASVEVVVALPVHLKINCGNNSPAVSGWEADAKYLVPGKEGIAYDFGGTHDLSGAANAAPHNVYQTVRHTDHQYTFPDLPDRTYTVRLHFTDGNTGGDGRAMDYTIEGIKVIDGLSIQKDAGGTNKALVKEFSVTVSDGNGMQIACDKDLGNDVFEAGIEIIENTRPVPLRLTSRLEGKTVGVGTQLVISWVANPDISGVVLEISPDGGKSYYPILSSNAIQPSDAAWTSGYSWKVLSSIQDSDGNPVSLLSNQVKIKAYNYSGEENDVTGPFTISPSGNIFARTRFASTFRHGIVLSGAGVLSVSAAKGSSAQLYSPSGVILRSADISSDAAVSWSMKSLPAGAYLVGIRGPMGQVNEKILWAR